MTRSDDFPLAAVNLAALRWFDPQGRAVQRVYASEQCDILLVGWEPGQQSSYHDHDDSESVVYVLEGCITAENDGVKRLYGPSSLLITPRTVHHRMSNESAERAVTLHLYTPPMAGGVSQPYRDHTPS